MNRNVYIWLTFLFLVLEMMFFGSLAAQEKAYDPLISSIRHTPETLDLIVQDTGRQRTIPVLIYLSARKSPAPVVLFSHGLGGSREGNSYLGQHWAARGYAAVFVQHPGSDTAVWQGLPSPERRTAMNRAANLRNFQLRVRDIPAVLDQLARWNVTRGHGLKGRLDLTRIGMSGHSLGAITAQAVSGQSFQSGNSFFTDSRIKAAIMFSPSIPRMGTPEQAFGRVKIPWMLMTGTKDIAPIGTADMRSRLEVFPALLPGGKYEVVLHGAEHSAFNDRSLPGDTERRNPNHHRTILALSIAFWDSWLSENFAARTWLNGDGPRSVMEKTDRWQTK
jgi:predicted dienelactone hydrolase